MKNSFCAHSVTAHFAPISGSNNKSHFKSNESIIDRLAPIADWIVKPVPDHLALADERFYIHYGSWFAAIQLTRLEAYRAIELVGSSRDSETIWWAIE
ncbi:MAG: hypothetical protein LH702_18620, partial [Phormidesmis sp. CAN_BIN44]|nr:hypothetical protein [Phormidesmis sp. CAN_BIN44]